MIVRIDPDAVNDAARRLAIQASAVEHTTSQLRAGAPSVLPEGDFVHVSAELDFLGRAGRELAMRTQQLSREVTELAKQLSSATETDSALSAALTVILGDAAADDDAISGIWDHQSADPTGQRSGAREELFEAAVRTGLEAAAISWANNPVNVVAPAARPAFPPQQLLDCGTPESIPRERFGRGSDETSASTIGAALELSARADELAFVCQFRSGSDAAKVSAFATDGNQLMALDRVDDEWRATRPQAVNTLLWSLVDAVGVIERPGMSERVSIPLVDLAEATRERKHDFLSGDRIQIRRTRVHAGYDATVADGGTFDDELTFVGERGLMRAAFQVGDDVVFARVEEELLVGLFGLALGPRNHPPILPNAELTPDTLAAISSPEEGAENRGSEPVSHALVNNVGLASASWLVAEGLAPGWLRALMRPEAVLTHESVVGIDGGYAGAGFTSHVSVAAGAAAGWRQTAEGIAVSVHPIRGLRSIAERWLVDAGEGDTISLLARHADGAVQGEETEIPAGFESDPDVSTTLLDSMFAKGTLIGSGDAG